MMIFWNKTKAPSRQGVIKQLITLSKYDIQVQGGSDKDSNIISACDCLMEGDTIHLYKEHLSFRTSLQSLPKLAALLDPKHTGLTNEEIEVSEKMKELAKMGHEFTKNEGCNEGYYRHEKNKLFAPVLPAVIASFRLLKGLPVTVDKALVIRGESTKTVLNDVRTVHEKFSEVANVRKDLGDMPNSQPQKPTLPLGKLKREGIDN